MKQLYFKWFCLSLSEKILDIINYFIAPILVLLADENGWLPKWLSWFQTPDNSLDGDKPWQERRRPFKTNTGIRKYLNRVFWLYRNSCYGFANSVLGISKNLNYTLYTDFNDFKKPEDYDRVGGKALRWFLEDNHKQCVAFQYYHIIPYFKGKRCIRINLGWKLWDWFNPKWSKCSIVLSINPWKSTEDP